MQDSFRICFVPGDLRAEDSFVGCHWSAVSLGRMDENEPEILMAITRKSLRGLIVLASAPPRTLRHWHGDLPAGKSRAFGRGSA